ncbi:M1 family aminopeptidase [Rhodanobacter sp. KK11]|uniref:ABC transporter permease/M1 family aminopeptidase n=1 Tax=Rhodanobacter sp. KK11 TaxID=3083255 RepID=UPI00296609B5|nr:M1 family aminopeptidase [Rhodanobacter sp. KK11]MDW2980213.1 M1 family aminopeptidase [Rhodanobacter sp. KK11]
MFFEILGFELRQQLKAPLFWIVAAVFGALAFALASTDAVIVGGASGNVLRNAPLVIARLLGVLTVLSTFLVTVFVAGAALRDFEQRTAELFFATPISRGAYLGGRFAAGYLAALAVMLVCALGLAIGGLMPWIDAARLGPASWRGYVWAFGVMVVPDMLFIAALLFLLATTTRSLLATYIGLIAYFVLNSVVGLLTRDVNNHFIAAMLDPFGGRTLALVTRYWSTDQANHELPTLSGVLLFNRLLWSAVGVAMLGAAMALFRPNREGLQLPRRKPRAEPPLLRPQAGATTLVLPKVRLADDLHAHLLQLRTQFVFDTVGVLRGAPFLIMLALGLLNLIFALALSSQIYGTATWPVTHQVLENVRGSFQWLLYIIVTFYAGELVWRERSQRSAEVSDASPVPDWVPLTAKLGALLAVTAAFLLIGAVVGMLWQLGHGYTHLEPGLYLATLALNAVPFVLLAVLALFLQVLSNNKFLGYLLTIVWLVLSTIGFSLLHWEQNLYNYGNAPDVPYSDMNGFGHFLGAALWFDFYWACAAAALLVLAALFWVRGTGQSWRERLREARARLHAPAKFALAAALLAFVGSGVWIYYNTNVLNHFRNSTAKTIQRADYEKKYAKYKDLPQPRITAVKADVDIFPYRRRLAIRGHYTLVNKTAAPIDELHVNFNDEFTVESLNFAPHDTVSADKDLGYTIYRLNTPLAPGASMSFDFELEYAPKGFTNSPEGQFLAHNGSFFNNTVMPQFGYQTQAQLTDRNDRRKYGLSAEVPRMPKLGDEKARANTYISNDADWISFDTTVSTAPDQIAVAPGYLQKEWTANGRRYFHYTMTQDGKDQPMLPFFSYLSARYAVKHEAWKGVDIAVYYNPAHAWNVERMIQGAKDALDYYDANFTPYQFRQLRILEFPNYASFAQSFANTIPYSESLGFIADLRDTSKIDYVYYVTAHEVAHQWWAHRVIGANMQGSTMLSESLSQYSALMVMKHKYGADQMHKFLKYELDGYLSGRATEKLAEEPLAKVENQQYIHYRKGSLVFYALQDYLGEGKLDAMLKQFLLDKGFQQPPYTTSQEFMDALGKAVDPQWQPLLDDLFWKITLFDNRITEARAKKLPGGRYEVTLKVHASKVYVDGTGRETAAKPDIPIEVGVFAASTGDGRDGKPLYLQKRLLPDGDSTLTVTVDGKPAVAGVDPFNELIDRVSGDNRRAVTIQ